MLKKLPPSVIALLLQGAAFALMLLATGIAGLQVSLMLFALLCGLLAATLSHLCGLARWWLPIQLLFVPALVLMLQVELPPGLFLGAFLVLLLVYWSVFRSQVPLYLSSKKIWRAIECLLPAATGNSGFTFVDLGSGLGGVLAHLAKIRPDGLYTGVEVAPLPFLWSWLRIRLGGYRNCGLQWGSLWDCDLSKYDVVFAYLSPAPMEKLWCKARTEMRPGTLFISSTFAVPDQSPHEVMQVDDLHRSALLIWRM